MDAPEDFQATLAVQALVGQYAQLVDARELAGCADLFATDAWVKVAGSTRQGRDEIRAWLEAASGAAVAAGRAGKHIVSAVVMQVGHGGSMAARTDMVYIGAAAGEPWGVVAVGEYHDTFVTQDGAWKFASREIVFTAKPQAPA